MDKKNVIEVAFNTTLEGVIITDQNEKIILANKAIEVCFGHKVDFVIGKDISIFLPKFLKDIHSSYYKSFYKKNKNHHHLTNPREVIGLHKDGRLLPLEIRINLFDFEGKKYTKASISDISIRKEKEEIARVTNMKLKAKIKKNTEELEKVVKELQKTNTALETEVYKKAQAKRKVRKALIAEQELGKLKSNFISLASHEFRTPLSGILTSATLLGKYINQKSIPISKHLHVIKSLVRHLNNILDDFLSLERVEKGDIQYEFTNFPLNNLINDIINESNTFLKNGQTIKYTACKECPNMYQDKKIIYVILTNIIFNAIKYSHENTTIEIVVIKDKDISILVSDNGIGIPKEDQKYIFKRFFRASNTAHLQGTGIGLNIVKSNIEALGGKISFKSKENKGTIFTICIPQVITTKQNFIEQQNEKVNITNRR